MNFSEIFEGTASYGVIFIYGILTSIHCIGMCGGFVIAGSSSGKRDLKSAVFYNLGRVISYTTAGFLAGSIGSLFVLTGWFKALLPLTGSILMIILALNFLGILKKFKIHPPEAVSKFTSKFLKNKNKNMFYTGLLTALLPCGPMQGIQFFALASADSLKGALAMFMLHLFSSFINLKFKKNAVKFSGCILIIMASAMFFRSITLMGFDTDVLKKSFSSRQVQASEIKNSDEQILYTEFNKDEYPDVSFKKGIPVKWIINVKSEDAGDCRASLEIPEYNIKTEFKEGENIIEFTPKEEKEIVYSSICGMIKGKIIIS